MNTLIKITATIVSFVLAFQLSTWTVFAQDQDLQAKLEEVFRQHNAVGTFALHDPAKDQLILVNAKRAAERKIPASTFKITNSLIALETKVVANENEIIPYGGKPQLFKSWERDMSMRAGIRISNVPVFQELASRVGIERYEKWLKVLDYGNGAVGQDVKTFWLQGPLKISAIEQVKFLSSLAQKKLPISTRSQEIVADIIRLETKGKRILYGKTGWTSTPNPQIGWFVGWVKNERGLFSFALNMDIVSRSDARKRKLIVLELLGILDIY